MRKEKIANLIYFGKLPMCIFLFIVVILFCFMGSVVLVKFFNLTYKNKIKYRVVNK